MYTPYTRYAASLFTSCIFAVTSTSALASTWTGEGEAGVVIISGNSDSEVVHAGLNLSKKVDTWEHGLEFAANSAESDGDKNAESYLAAYNLKYDISAKRFLWGDLRYLDDKFDSFDRIVTLGAGYGYRFANSEELKWTLSGGVGYRDTEVEATGEDISGAAFIGESKLKLKLTENTHFIDDFRVETTEDNSYVENKAGIMVSMTDRLSLKVTYRMKYNSDPAPGDTSTDSITSVNVVYKM